MAFYHTMCFVFTVLIICNAVLYPSIFSSVFRKWFGWGADGGEKEKLPDMPPQMRGGSRTSGPNRRMEMERAAQRNIKHAADPASYFAQQKQEASKGRGVLGSVLPVYAVGIVIYFAYIMYRIFLKDKSKTNESGSSTGSSLWDTSRDGASLQRVQQEQLHKQLSEQLRADNYSGIKAKKASKGSKPRHQPARKKSDTSEGTPDEMAALKKRLEDTERSMQRMMDMMNSMGIAMSQVTEQLTGSVPINLADSLNSPAQQADDEASDEGQRSSEDGMDSILDSEDDDASGQEEASLEKKTSPDGDEADCSTDDDGGDVEILGGAEMEGTDTVRRRLVPAVGGES